MTASLRDLLLKQKIIVCCGAGGVGKTSTSAALALYAARHGRKTLVITIDPAKRLAETLGISGNPSEPVALSPETANRLGVATPGQLSAWLLDPQKMSDKVVRRLSKTPGEAAALLDNSLYRNISSIVAGMQEYTAVEAMYQYDAQGAYDLIILDTPPSRNALNFLQAPKRISRFLEGRFFRLFLPDSASLVKRASSHLVNKVLDLSLGQDTREELTSFFGLFSDILNQLGGSAERVQQLFRRPTTSFLVITSPEQAALDDAGYFGKKSRDELGLPLAGYIFNRSLLDYSRYQLWSTLPGADTLSRAIADELDYFVDQEEKIIAQQRERYEQLRQQLLNGEFLYSLPCLPGRVNDLSALMMLVNYLDAHPDQDGNILN